MTYKNKIEELAKELRMVANMINMGEKIQWARETTLMDKAADALEALTPMHTTTQCKHMHCKCTNPQCPNYHFADCEAKQPHHMTHDTREVEEMERLIAEEIPIEDGGFVNYADADRYANTGYDMELIVKRFKEILHHQLQKAREEALDKLWGDDELQIAIERYGEWNEEKLDAGYQKAKQRVLSELDQDTPKNVLQELVSDPEIVRKAAVDGAEDQNKLLNQDTNNPK